ncbi:serine hydrolase domain-containing protein [Flagellimonas sp.]|uniref:serine hydrolase domain-containing protein n=1 Tax=Flagellimonas sp. TaxID=2058762 RepID=UPI003B5B770A
MSIKVSNFLRVTSILTMLGLILTSIGCNKDDNPQSSIDNQPSNSENSSYNYSIPEEKQDGWSIASVEDVGIDKILLEEAISKIVDGNFVKISSVLIARDGKLIVDELFRTTLDNNDAAVRNTNLNIHTMQSATKSFTSALMGIAIDKGYINSIEIGFYTLFPGYSSFENWSDSKNDITLENVLTMQHGWQYNEWDYPIESDQNTLFFIYRNHSDFVKGLLDLPMSSEPGNTFVYSTMASHALGAAISSKSNKSIPDFAQEYLFGPLQFGTAYWLFSPANRAMTGCCLFISGRDMTKLGQLYLDEGRWNGKQIISSDWIEKSITSAVHLDLGFTDGYGYQWWMKEFIVNGQSMDTFFAAGNGGQFIYVFPSLNAVISFTGENYGSQTMYQVTSLLEDYLLKAFK